MAIATVEIFPQSLTKTFVGSYDTPGTARDVYVSGGYTFIADCGGGVQIIDITDPSSPTFAGSYNTQWALGVEVTARPTAGYVFSGWTGNISEAYKDDNPVTITMDSDKTITANFSSELGVPMLD